MYLENGGAGLPTRLQIERLEAHFGWRPSYVHTAFAGAFQQTAPSSVKLCSIEKRGA